MNLEKHRTKLIAARDEMNRTIAAIETVLAYVGVGFEKRTGRVGRPPNIEDAIKEGDIKTGVKKSTLTKPLRPKKAKKAKKVRKVSRIRHLSAEGEARRRAGYFAWVKRRQEQKAGKAA